MDCSEHVIISLYNMASVVLCESLSYNACSYSSIDNTRHLYM